MIEGDLGVDELPWRILPSPLSFQSCHPAFWKSNCDESWGQHVHLCIFLS